jgi:antitoxin component HigA of HigAB toxin-antitoxin module
MRRALAITLLVLAASALLPGQDVLDRIVVKVNGQPILLSDWDLGVRYEAFVEQRPLPLEENAALAVLDRLIDQELLREQMPTSHVRPVSSAEVAERVQEIRKATPGCASDAGFRDALARYGLNEAELAERVGNQLEVLRFIDGRLRPAVHVDRASVESYYNGTLLPELRRKGGRETPLTEVRAQIEEVLSQQRVDALLSDWLKELRQHSEVHRDIPAKEPAASSTARREVQ